MNNYFKVIVNGLIKENPTFVLLLGCALPGDQFGIKRDEHGIGTMFVLICSNAAISALKNLIPDMVRIPALLS